MDKTLVIKYSTTATSKVPFSLRAVHRKVKGAILLIKYSNTATSKVPFSLRAVHREMK